MGAASDVEDKQKQSAGERSTSWADARSRGLYAVVATERRRDSPDDAGVVRQLVDVHLDLRGRSPKLARGPAWGWGEATACCEGHREEDGERRRMRV